MRRSDLLVALAAFSAFLAVALGAWGSHMAATQQAADWFRTASSIALPHAVAVIAIRGWRPELRLAPALLLAGSLIFAGTLQALAFGAPGGVALLAPVGGTLMLAGWLALLVAAIRPASR